MIIIEVKDLTDLEYLYNISAMTWSGLKKESFNKAMELCCLDGEAGVAYLTSGKLMNELCHLTGERAYPDDLNIFSIPRFKGLAFEFGARWMDDIIENNALASEYHPFNKEDNEDEE